jgi:hypothetical protein
MWGSFVKRVAEETVIRQARGLAVGMRFSLSFVAGIGQGLLIPKPSGRSGRCFLDRMLNEAVGAIEWLRGGLLSNGCVTPVPGTKRMAPIGASRL